MFRRKARAESPTVPQTAPREPHGPLPPAGPPPAEQPADHKGPPYTSPAAALASTHVVSALESLLQPAPAEPLPLADAFSNLLAVEEGEASPDATAPGDAEALELLLDRLSARVAERLEGHGAFDRIASVVHDVAERLVREEIEHIRLAAAQRA